MEAQHEYDVVLLPTFTQVEAWRKRQALQQTGGLFGPTVTTFDAWVGELWEMYGDGRIPVDSTRRNLAMHVAFAQVHGEDDLPPGLPLAALRCERLAAGVCVYDQAVEAAAVGTLDTADITPPEVLFLKAIARYRELLILSGFVEPGQAVRLLADNANQVFARPLKVLVANAAPLDWRMQAFFERCSQLDVSVDMAKGAGGIGCLPDGKVPRMALPSGSYATAGLVADIVRSLGPGEKAVVATRDPRVLYTQLESALVHDGIATAVQAQVRLGSTDMGRAYVQLAHVFNDPWWSRGALADVLYTPFAGVSPSYAQAYDCRLRADRLAQREDCLRELTHDSPDFAALLGLVKGTNGRDAIAHFENLVLGMEHRSPYWRSEQMAALGALRLVLQMADELGAEWKDVLDTLENTVVSVPYRVGSDDDIRLLITTQGGAAQLEEGSFDVLIATDLTAYDYPIADPDDAASTLFGKLGLAPVDDALSRARRTFWALSRVPSRDLVCLRPVNDQDGNPAYPCAMLEELVDAYRNTPSDKEDDLASGVLPEVLDGRIVERGEELLYANSQAAAVSVQQPLQGEYPLLTGATLTASPGQVLPPRYLPEGQGVLPRSLSPSQVEMYLECPYRWFAERRLGARRLEETFGPIERGNFAHEVLERFYRCFADQVAAKVNENNIEDARSIMRQVANQVEREMTQREPGQDRLVAATRLERYELAQLKEQLVRYLDFETRLLPGFHPAYLEQAFDAGHAALYAGCPMVGTIDRIDVDDAGHAVVIDYKGSLGPAYDIAGKNSACPGKVQTRMYAQMARRELGLNVVGAIYVSYGAHAALHGAVDARVVEAAWLPAARYDDLACTQVSPVSSPDVLGTVQGDTQAFEADVQLAECSFVQMLDYTERIIEQAVARLEAGEIPARPASPVACEYCRVADCPERQG